MNSAFGRSAAALSLVLLATFSARPALAQQGQYAAVQGHVVDQSGAAMPGVTVVVTHQGSGMYRQVVSNADGSYYVANMVPGPYRVTAELPGFKKYEQPDVLLTIGNTTALEIKLAVGGVEEAVTVTGESPLVDVTSKQIGANIGQAELNALPIMNKNWMFAVGLTPGIQIQSSTASFACESLIVGGGSNRSGNFSIDGGGNNDDYLGSSCGSQVRPALESVQEFQVLTNQYDAEFGRTAGAIVNAITKQGTNQLHGSLFDSYTDDHVTAMDFFVAQSQGSANAIQKPHTAQKDYGGTIGGPIKKDKAHFFYSLDRLVYDEGRSNTFAARPELNYANTQSMKLWNNMVRVDHQVNATNTWTARFLQEVSPTYNRVAGRWTLASRDQEYDVDKNMGGNWNTILGNNRFNQIRAGYTYEKNGFTAKEVQDGVPMTQLAPTLTMLTFVDGTRNGAQFRIDNAYELSESFTQFVPEWGGGSHDLKFGAQYIYSQIELPDQTDMNGRFAFSTDKAFNASDPFTYPERLQIRVPAASDIVMPTHVAVFFARIVAAQEPDAELGGARPGADLIPNASALLRLHGRHSKHRAANRCRSRRAQRDIVVPRRLRILRQGHPADDDVCLTGVSASLTASPPPRPISGLSCGQMPADPPSSTARRAPAAINAFPPDRLAQHRQRVPGQPRSRGARRPPSHVRLRAAVRAADGGHGGLHPQLEPRSAHQLRPQPGAARRHEPDGPADLYRSRQPRRPVGDRAVRQPGADAHQRRFIAVRRRELHAREALQQSLAGARLVCGRLRARELRGEPDQRQQLPGPRRSAARSEFRSARC